MKRPITQFMTGLQLCLKGFYCALTTREVWEKHRKCYAILLSIILCLYLVCFALYIPVYISLYLASFVLEVEQWFGDTSIEYQATQLFTTVSFYIPLVIVFVTQYLLPSFSEDVFFATFYVLNPVKSETYRAIATVGFWSILSLRIRRYLRLSVWSLVAYSLSFIPLVGWMVFPLAQFYLISKIFGYKTALAVSAFLLFPSLKGYSWPLVKLMFGARALAIETLDPYFSRFGYEKIKLVEKAHQPVLLGFAAPFLFLMAVPILGPLFWGLVQASAPVLLLNVERDIVV